MYEFIGVIGPPIVVEYPNLNDAKDNVSCLDKLQANPVDQLVIVA